MSGLDDLFEHNRRWVAEHLERDPLYFKSMANGQRPDYLWVGCSDSRVMANEITGLAAGELFVHRNIANQALHTDFNWLSVLQFGIDHLRVKHVIVCGHYGCGGVEAAMGRPKIGLADNWLRHIRDVYREHRTELELVMDSRERLNRLVELNVSRQVLNVAATTIVQGAWARGHEVHVHGLVYSLEDGHVKEICTSISGFDQLEWIYREGGA
jgi:carbonic anhydrase